MSSGAVAITVEPADDRAALGRSGRGLGAGRFRCVARLPG
ncbi:hypothetical protein CSB93_5646 [Pseudomonas paraeruginosa]|uniref:Uncharacterized protein n=1 Tax=Pseudomonas paraeruginosa TaxID=2994495 RepID=A0A2R3J2P0_9PSED|nr:hypothetical protein CSB93_5646 [Pseudomonas paraeruginosa]AWE94367.1 hypothetical protein CSC28_4445 [Pseudomonas paraeruginosa]